MPRSRNVLYIGTNRHVAAIDPKTGEEVWRTKLPLSTGAVVTILIQGRRLLVGAGGHLFCLDRGTGEIIWKNDLPKMGYQPVLLAMEGAQGSACGDVSAADAVSRRRSTGATM